MKVIYLQSLPETNNSKKETLLLLRNIDKSEGGLWLMPDGKIDEEESISKELKSETPRKKTPYKNF